MSEHENKNVDMPSAEVAFEGFRSGMFAEVSGQLVWPAHQPGRQVPHISTNNIMIIFKGITIFIIYFLRKKRKVAPVQQNAECPDKNYLFPMKMFLKYKKKVHLLFSN